jgi:hypothetical protein
MSFWRKWFAKPQTQQPTVWRVGERVLARWHDSYFYPGRIHAVSGSSCEIHFDDGDTATVDNANVLAPDVRVGSRVFARWHGGPEYLPGVISQQKGETVQIDYDHGETEWTSLSMVRVERSSTGAKDEVRAAQPTRAEGLVDVGEPIDGGAWRVGDRVLARWYDFYWYPGTILTIGTKGYHILYDDGDQRVVRDLALAPLTIDEGEHIQIRPKNQPDRVYANATVTHVDGESLEVMYEDDEHEANTRVSRARFWRCPVTTRPFSFEEGDRVLAHDVDEYIYPAEIVTVHDDRVIVQFADGPQRMLTPELIRRYELRPGCRIECRWKAGPHHFPGILAQLDGERVYVHYDDGDKEWTSVRLIRIKPEG